MPQTALQQENTSAMKETFMLPVLLGERKCLRETDYLSNKTKALYRRIRS